VRYDEDSKKGKDSVIIISTFMIAIPPKTLPNGLLEDYHRPLAMGDFQGLCQCRGSRRWNL